MRELLTTLLLAMLVLPVLMTGCAQSGSDSNTPAPPGGGTPDQNSWTGRLQGGMMHIGGEGTGWVLRVESGGEHAGKTLDVDVSQVLQQARAFDGRRVRIEGKLFEKRYVERGPTQVLSASAIRAAE